MCGNRVKVHAHYYEIFDAFFKTFLWGLLCVMRWKLEFRLICSMTLIRPRLAVCILSSIKAVGAKKIAEPG